MYVFIEFKYECDNMTKQKYTLFRPSAPEFSQGAGKMGIDEKEYMDQAVNAYKRGETIDFSDYIHKMQWQYFYDNTKGLEGSVELMGPIPKGWPVDDKMHIKVLNTPVYKNSIEILTKKDQFPFLGIKRDAKSLDKHFLLTYGSPREHERECIMQVLERLKVLEQSLYSRPDVKPELQKHVDLDYVFPIRNNDVKYRNIEGTDKVLDKKYLYNPDKTMTALYKAAKRTHCWAVLDVYPFNDNLNGIPTEKFLWPVFLGIPFIYIGSQHQRDVLRSWGFEPNDSFRADIRSTVEQMMWLRSIFDDKDLAQEWQDSQGLLIMKNRRALDQLPDLIKNNPV